MNSLDKKTVQHHTHYLEVDGYDEIVEMDKGDHYKLHKRLREEGRCNIPVKELSKIARAAHARTPLAKQYSKTPKVKEYRKQYQKKNMQTIYFEETQCKNIYLREQIIYNNETGKITVSSGFVIRNRSKNLC